MVKSKTFRTKLLRDGAEGFGKVRAPVKVTINGYTFRSTIAKMSGDVFVPLRTSNREAAGIGGEQRTCSPRSRMDMGRRSTKS